MSPVSMQMSSELEAADGFSCREQIRHPTGLRAHHFAEVVWDLLGRSASENRVPENRQRLYNPSE